MWDKQECLQANPLARFGPGLVSKGLDLLVHPALQQVQFTGDIPLAESVYEDTLPNYIEPIYLELGLQMVILVLGIVSVDFWIDAWAHVHGYHHG